MEWITKRIIPLRMVYNDLKDLGFFLGIFMLILIIIPFIFYYTYFLIFGEYVGDIDYDSYN